MKPLRTSSTNRVPMALLAIALGSLALAGTMPGKGHPQSQRKSTDPPMASHGKLGQDLFLAIDHRDLKGVQALIGKGADPNSRNGLEFTPLYIAAASHQTEVMAALLAAGASPDAGSPYGSPLLFAAATGNVNGAKLLLDRGANINTSRGDGNTVLMTASASGNPAFVGELLKRKVDVDAKNVTDATALHYAARAGNTEVCRMLIEAGAKIDAVDIDGQTPLMMAARNGHVETAKLLLAKGAQVDARDKKKRTALLQTATYGDYPEIVQTLLAAGADAKATDLKKRDSASISLARGNMATANLLGAREVTGAKREVKTAIDFSLKAIQGSMADFAQNTACISCHQEGLGRMATAIARNRGFKLDAEVDKIQRARVTGALNAMMPLHQQALKSSDAMKQVPLIEINEVSTGYSWLMAGMAFQNDPSNNASAATAQVLARQQQKAGNWSFSLPRIPMQSSVFTLTALSAKSIKTYGGKEYRAENEERLMRAKHWLASAPAKTSDDLAFRLLGLVWIGSTAGERTDAIQDLLKAQNADGGWSQIPGLHSDAYATGQALYALLQGGGVKPGDSVCKKAVDYLVRTQDDDGTWFVNKRAFPANNYFDAGFSHGESQYASFNGTCWAIMALSEALGR